MTPTPEALSALARAWGARWPEALAVWSPYTKLAEPRLCVTEEDEEREHLQGSFAMIRVADHAVVIGLREVLTKGITAFPLQVLAHEIGHHVFAPGDLRDNARLLARIRRGLPGQEDQAGLVANLYLDLLVNDRLHREKGLDMAAVYRALRQPGEDPPRLWRLYLRTYELLWSLPSGDLTPNTPVDDALEADAGLAARLVRAYTNRWLDGASRYACLLLPYLMEQSDQAGQRYLAPWLDTRRAGEGDAVPDGLAELDDDELLGPIHPAEDPELSGLTAPTGSSTPGDAHRELPGGQKNQYRPPTEYAELMASLGVKVSPSQLAHRYYRELALPHIIPFPQRVLPRSTDPLPEGLDVWDPGSPLSDVDWIETVSHSPVVIPGVTTLERRMGESAGAEPERRPPDLYLGVDCSGSMNNPRQRLSWPVLSGAVITLSALRAGAKVMVCLSGEPGSFTETQGFLRHEDTIFGVLTDYLGTGYSYGILRLKETFLDAPPPKNPVHLLIVSDSDIFHMLGAIKEGWDIFAQALTQAGGGGTLVLDLPFAEHYAPQLDRVRSLGWGVHLVRSQEELLSFARAFSRLRFGPKGQVRTQ
ncbi:VWA domain-containing protein [Myxococcota bacterium]|nr:VWA domain-containing protein [Myxococcota bacterium]